jgi:hypothetical protein
MTSRSPRVPAPDRSLVTRSLAQLFAPADRSIPCTLLDAGAAWRVEQEAITTDVAIWGSAPTVRTKAATGARWAVNRELDI